MDVKISITTKCNAKCATCPVWKYPGQHMELSHFKVMWDKIISNGKVSRILLNNTGDMYNHPQNKEIFQYIEAHQNPLQCVIMTTNAAKMDYVPKIHGIVISFNGGDKESYEKTTGLNFEDTVKRVKDRYEEFKVKLKYLDMHCLIWKGNEGCEEKFKALWADFPGIARFSYKYDNQMEEDHTLDKYKRTDRIYCDYLDRISIMPNGQIISCPHDFKSETDYGNFLKCSIGASMHNWKRAKKRGEHRRGIFTGLCEQCNYNTPVGDRLVEVKKNGN